MTSPYVHASEWRARALQLRAITQWLSHPTLANDLRATADRWETIAETAEESGEILSG